MDSSAAKKYLTNTTTKGKPSLAGEAVDVLYDQYGSYQAVAKEVSVSANALRKRHRIFLLPHGIRWKVDEGQISLDQGYQISRLESEDDQWLLAFTITEETLSAKECEDVVRGMGEQNRPVRDVLYTLLGVRFDRVVPLLLPLPFDLRFAMSRVAWHKRQQWQDLSFDLIRQGLAVDLHQIAGQLRALATQLEKAGSPQPTGDEGEQGEAGPGEESCDDKRHL